MKNDFNVVFTMLKIYYKEEGDNLLSTSACVDVMNLRQVYSSKLISIFINHLHYLVYANDLSMKCS